jgi:hypothetical protein
MKNFVLLVSLIFCVLTISIAQVPQKISYQGLLSTSSGAPVQDGSYDLQFDVYNLPSSGSLKYTETHNNVTVKRGAFSIILRPTTAIFAESLFVEITATSGPGISSPIIFSPRSELTSAPYAFRADTARYALSAPGQWSANGSDIYYNGGNVGIGTTSPSAKLHIYEPGGISALRIESGQDGIPEIFINKAATNNKSSKIRFAQNNTEYFAIGYDLWGNNTDIFTLYDSKPGGSGAVLNITSGRVGIGTTTPSTKLEINGQVKITGGSPGTGKVLTSDASGLASWQTQSYLSGSGAPNYIPKFSTPTALGNSSVYDAGGYVGIGTPSPSYNLDVAGTARVNGQFRVGTTALLFEPSSSTVSSTSSLTISSVSSVNIGAGSGVVINPGAGDVVIPGTGDFQLSKARKGGVVFVGTSGKYREDSAKFFWDSTNARLGIGNSGPAYPLDVTGDLNSSAKYRIGGTVVLDNSGTNLFVGGGAGASNGAGTNNTFIGVTAGGANTSGFSNTFVGNLAGSTNATGQENSFVGHLAGNLNTGTSNTFLGFKAGTVNAAANYNTFVGAQAGQANQTGGTNSYFGKGAGLGNISGNSNVAVGVGSGASNIVDDENTFLGFNSDGMAGITNATAVGSKAKIMQSNSLVLGSISGLNGAVNTVKVGIGTAIPNTRLDMDGDLALRKNPNVFMLNGGNNNNIAFGDYSFVQVVGGGGISLTGIANGVNGKVLIIYCANGSLTITNNDANSLFQNQIRTMSNAAINIVDEGSVTLVYNTNNQKWIVTAFMP